MLLDIPPVSRSLPVSLSPDAIFQMRPYTLNELYRNDSSQAWLCATKIHCMSSKIIGLRELNIPFQPLPSKVPGVAKAVLHIFNEFRLKLHQLSFIQIKNAEICIITEVK